MRPRPSRLFVLLPLAACMAAGAQTAPASAPLEENARLEGRRNQKVERIHVEDDRVVIDEVRHGGQTESITVQPKSGLPAYEIQPQNLARSRPGDDRGGASGGARVWNILNF